MSESSESDASPPPPPRRRGARARDVPFSEMTIVEKQVARMMRQRDEEDAERHRLSQRAEALRKDGEAALIALGDLDEDSDSEAEDDDVAGAMGRARRDARRLGTLVRITAPGSNPAPPAGAGPPAPVDVIVRAMTPAELGMAYAWMRRDQRRYEGATKFWDNASAGIQSAFEEPDPPGHPTLLDAPGVAPLPRVVGAFHPALGPAPVAFALLKDDGLTVDAMGVRQGLRRLGIGAAVARRFVDRARAAAVTRAGPPTYDVDAVPAAVAFWTALGFERAKTGADSPTTKVMRRLCGDVAMTLELVADPPEPEGGEWWAPKSARGGGGEKDAARRMGWSSDDD